MNRPADVAVIGAGPGGCAAAVQCVRLGLDTLLVDSTGGCGGLLVEARLIENYPGLEDPVSGLEFADRLRKHLERFDLTVEKLHVDEILREDSGGFALKGREKSLRARSVIVATGTVPVELDLDVSGSPQLHRSILPFRSNPCGRIAVIGGGEAAADYSLSLSDMGASVTMILRGDRLRLLDGSRLKQDLENRSAVGIMYNTHPKIAEEKEGATVLHVRTPRGSAELPVDAILAAVGREAALPSMPEDFQHSGEGTNTSVPGLFLVGDVALGSLGQAGIAVGHGLIAAGKAARYLTGTG